MLDARFASSEDLRFVRDSWFESYRRGGYAPDIGFDLLQAGQKALIEHLTGSGFVVVAFLEKTPDEIISWISFQGPRLHYIYTKSAYRRMGFAAGLIDLHGPFKFFSQQTRTGNKLAKKYFLRFNPYLTMKGTL